MTLDNLHDDIWAICAVLTITNTFFAVIIVNVIQHYLKGEKKDGNTTTR